MPHFCTGHRTSPRPHPPLYPQAKKSHQASCSAVPRPLHNQMPPAAPGTLSATRTTTAPEFQSLTGHVSAPCSPWNTAANALPPSPAREHQPLSTTPLPLQTPPLVPPGSRQTEAVRLPQCSPCPTSSYSSKHFPLQIRKLCLSPRERQQRNKPCLLELQLLPTHV